MTISSEQYRLILFDIANSLREYNADRPGVVEEVDGNKMRVKLGQKFDGAPYLSEWIYASAQHGAMLEQATYVKGQNVWVSGLVGGRPRVSPYASSKQNPTPPHAEGVNGYAASVGKLRVAMSKPTGKSPAQNMQSMLSGLSGLQSMLQGLNVGNLLSSVGNLQGMLSQISSIPSMLGSMVSGQAGMSDIVSRVTDAMGTSTASGGLAQLIDEVSNGQLYGARQILEQVSETVDGLASSAGNPAAALANIKSAVNSLVAQGVATILWNIDEAVQTTADLTDATARLGGSEAVTAALEQLKDVAASIGVPASVLYSIGEGIMEGVLPQTDEPVEGRRYRAGAGGVPSGVGDGSQDTVYELWLSDSDEERKTEEQGSYRVDRDASSKVTDDQERKAGTPSMKLRISEKGYITGRVDKKMRFAAHKEGAKIKAEKRAFVAYKDCLICTEPPVLRPDPIKDDDA